MIVWVGLLDKSDDYISRLANYQADGSNKEGKSVSTGQFFFVIGIVGMIASAVAAVFSARILRRQEKKLKEQIWNEYQ